MTDSNKTGTELKILQSIEQAYFRNNKTVSKRNTDKSLKWFSSYIPRAYNKTRTSQIMRDQSLLRDTPTSGGLFFNHYDPIHKDKLPYYDKFPMLLPFDFWKKDGHVYMMSLNLHFLPPALRYEAFKAILKFRNEKRYRKSTRLRMEWSMLKSLSNSKLFEHCIRVYRMDHFRGKFIQIPPASWELALFLPTSRIVRGGGKATGSPYQL